MDKDAIVIKIEGSNLSAKDIKITKMSQIEAGNISKKPINEVYFVGKLKENPFGSYTVLAISGKVAGFLTFTGKKYNGYTIYELGDVLVEPWARGQALFYKMLNNFHRNFPQLVCYGTPNAAAAY